MTFVGSIKSVTRLTVALTMPVLLAGCQPISSIGIDPSVKGAASACDLLNAFDVRASRKDTPETQRTLYGLQKVKEDCNGGPKG